jgi:hypothetical protein
MRGTRDIMSRVVETGGTRMARFTIAAGLAAMFAAGLFVSGPANAQSVMKQCGDEWKAAKAANTTNGQTWRDFLKDCRARHASTTATTAPAAPAPSPTATPAAAPAPTASPKPAHAARTAHTTAGEFTTEAEAKGHCPTDQVVWVNNRSHKYHYSGDRFYGTTKHGAYMCEGEAKSAGDAPAKNSVPPKT